MSRYVLDGFLGACVSKVYYDTVSCRSVHWCVFVCVHQCAILLCLLCSTIRWQEKDCGGSKTERRWHGETAVPSGPPPQPE